MAGSTDTVGHRPCCFAPPQISEQAAVRLPETVSMNVYCNIATTYELTAARSGAPSAQCCDGMG